MAEPWLMRTEFHPMAHILRNGAYFLQQGYIGIHLNQISPRLVHGCDVPTHHSNHGTSSSVSHKTGPQLWSNPKLGMASD